MHAQYVDKIRQNMSHNKRVNRVSEMSEFIDYTIYLQTLSLSLSHTHKHSWYILLPAVLQP